MAQVIIEGGDKIALSDYSQTPFQYLDFHWYENTDPDRKIYRTYDRLGYEGNDTIYIIERVEAEFSGKYYINGQWSATPPSLVEEIVEEDEKEKVDEKGVKKTASTIGTATKAKGVFAQIKQWFGANATMAQNNLIYYIVGGLMVSVFAIVGFSKGWFTKKRPIQNEN